MPLVQVTMLTGRTADQKRKLAQRLTDAMVEEAGARREAVVVTFNEVSKESYASGGVLVADKNRKRGRSPAATGANYPSGSYRCPSTRSPSLGSSFLAYCRKWGAARWASNPASSLYCS